MIRWSRALTALASVALGVLAACSGGDSNAPDCDAIAAALVSRIEIRPPSATVNLGDSLQLSAVAYSCAGPMSAVNSFTWRSANDGQASVSPTGLVKAVTSGGAVEIFAAAQGKEGSSAITTRPVPLARVTVEPATATVGVNRTSTLTARGFDAQGREITGRPVQWSSANIGVVTVDQTGRITGVAAGGPVAVTATIEGQSAASQVSVALVPVSTITVTPGAATIAAGTTQQFTATLRDELGNALTGRAVNWTSSDPLIASVNAATGLVTGNKPGNITLTATSEGRSSTAQVTVNVGAPARLAFVQQPSAVQVGSTMSPAVTVEIQDAAGNRVTTANSQVTLATSPSVTLDGNTATAVNGLATFSNLTVGTPGTYTLVASSPGLANGTSSGFTVSPRPATRVAFVQQPTIDTAGKAITPAITVELQDVNGARVTTSGVPITIAIGTNPGASTLGGTVTQNTVNGVATFSNLTINKTGTGYTLTASSPGLTSATSSAFNILPGAPASLRLVTQPCTGSATCTAGTPLAQSPQFEVLDANGNRVTTGTGSNASVTVARTAGPGNATLSGTTTVTAANGLVTFGNLILNRSGNGYILTASATGLTSAATTAFDVGSGSGSVLSITSTIPSSVVSGSILPTISVQLLDANANPVTTAGVGVTLSLSPSGTLGGTTTQLTNASGVATFTGVTISAAGAAGYTVVASATNYTSDNSNPFTVTLPSFTLTVAKSGAGSGTVTSNTGGINCGATCAASFVSGTSVTLTANPASGSAFTGWSGGGCSGTGTCVVSVTAATTVTATFAQTATLTASTAGPGTGGVTSSPPGIACGAAGLDCTQAYVVGTSVTLTATPTAGSALSGWSGGGCTGTGTCVVTMNAATTVTATFVLVPNITTTSLPAATTGTAYSQSLAVSGGVAPFTWSLAAGDTLPTGLALSPGGVVSGTPTATGQVDFTVRVSDAGGRTDAQALTLDVAAGFVGGVRELAFLVGPTNVNAGAAISPPVQVEVRDVNGNRVTTSTATIVMVFGNNAGNATLTGNTAQAAAGVATFANLRVSVAANGYTLLATSDGMQSATSAGFRVR